MKFYDYCPSPLGTLLLIEENHAITHLTLSDKEAVLSGFFKEHTGKEQVRDSKPEILQRCTPIITDAKKQLSEYFAGTRRAFELPLNPQGTPFQKKVWQALCTIPYGETRSYKEIALQIDHPKGCRAVGMANNRNPVMLLIPCHRVIGSNGALVGYAGGLRVKEWLLSHEKHIITQENQPPFSL